VIHPSAVVSPKARIGEGVEIGPHAVVGDDVVLGEGCVLMANAVVLGPAVFGRENRFFPGAVLGAEPQDLKFKGGKTRLEAGDRNLFREGVTVNRGTEKGGGVTRLGSDNLLMACSHVAHDCQLGDGIVMANGVLLAGHVRVESHVHLMGLAAVHQFCTIGRHAFVAGYSPVSQDVPPFMLVQGIPPRVRGVNEIGLGRHGFTPERIKALKDACRKLYRSGALRGEVLQTLELSGESNPDLKALAEALKASDQGKHGRALEAHRA